MFTVRWSGLTRVLLAAGVLFVAGCDDDDDDGGASGPPTFTPDPIVSSTDLRAALAEAVGNPPAGNGGLNLNMWATVVDRAGVVVAVVYTGQKEGDQWPGSRVISAQKANTANNFSLDGLALSTANLFTAVQPGGSLYGLQEANPVNPEVAYGGDAADYGTDADYMIGRRVGGTNVFGGGFALYNADGEIVGGVGVSGDTSCADHVIGWKVRHLLNLDNVPAGVSTTGDDNIIYIGGAGNQGFAQPHCADAAAEDAIAAALPTGFPTGPEP